MIQNTVLTGGLSETTGLALSTRGWWTTSAYSPSADMLILPVSLGVERNIRRAMGIAGNIMANFNITGNIYSAINIMKMTAMNLGIENKIQRIANIMKQLITNLEKL